MKLYVETIQAHKFRVFRSSDGQVHVSLTGNGTFAEMTPSEALALADSLIRAAMDTSGLSQREVA